MTSMINQRLQDGLPGTPSSALAFPVDAWIAGFLVVLLLFRLVTSAAERPGAPARFRIVDVAAIPLLLGFAAIVYSRIQEILPLG
jgi:hypothetical protein